MPLPLSPEQRDTASAASIAIFDLDGTLTRRDTLVPFVCRFLARRPGRWFGLWRVLPAVASFILGLSDRGQLKERIIMACLANATRKEIDEHGVHFLKHLFAGGMHNDALVVLEHHRNSGDWLVLLSASPNLYVPAIAAQLAFDECICTEVVWHGDRLSGKLQTENRRGEEKARIVRALKERGVKAVTAYGNSSSDLPHLRLVSRGVLVNGSGRARKEAAQSGISCVEWS